MMASSSQAPAPSAPAPLPVATLRELHGVADEISGLFCKIDNVTWALGALTSRFENDRDESAADFLIGEMENIVNTVDGKLFNITRALAPYREGDRDE